MSRGSFCEENGRFEVICKSPYVSQHMCLFSSHLPPVTTSLTLFFFLPLPFALSFSSRSFGKTKGLIASNTRGRAGFSGFRSHLGPSAGFSRNMRHSRTEYLLIRK